jgi:hypothetical protein
MKRGEGKGHMILSIGTAWSLRMFLQRTIELTQPVLLDIVAHVQENWRPWRRLLSTSKSQTAFLFFSFIFFPHGLPPPTILIFLYSCFLRNNKRK